MPDRLNELRELKLSSNGIEVELVGIGDESLDAAIRSERVQELVDKMVNLGRKRGRPRKEDDHVEKEAA